MEPFEQYRPTQQRYWQPPVILTMRSYPNYYPEKFVTPLVRPLNEHDEPQINMGRKAMENERKKEGRKYLHPD